MTYCIAWRTERAAFVVADAVISASPQELVEAYSSFGEMHLNDCERTVQEGALKIIVTGDTVLSFSGDAGLGFEAASVLRQAIASAALPRKAFETAVTSITPYPSGRSVNLLLAYWLNGKPTITTYDGNEFVEHDYFVQLGSVSTKYRGISERVIGRFSKGLNNPFDILATALSVIQSYGIHDHSLIERGIGGVYCGAFVDQHGAHPPPDVCYMLYAASQNETFREGQTVIASYREGVFVARSAVSIPSGGNPRCFTTRLPSEPLTLVHERARNALAQSLAITHTAMFDYAVFLNTQYRIVTIIQMKKHNLHRDLVIRGAEIGGLRQSMISVSPRLLRLLNTVVPPGQAVSPGFLGFHFVPFSPFQGMI
jgi:hypothetical protein